MHKYKTGIRYTDSAKTPSVFCTFSRTTSSFIVLLSFAVKRHSAQIGRVGDVDCISICICILHSNSTVQCRWTGPLAIIGGGLSEDMPPPARLTALERAINELACTTFWIFVCICRRIICIFYLYLYLYSYLYLYGGADTPY